MAQAFAQRLAARRREARALDLRACGLTYEKIARHLGFSNRGAAYKAVHRALLATVAEPAENVRVLEIQRLETIFRRVWPEVVHSRGPQQLRAIDTTLKIMDRINRLSGLELQVTKYRATSSRTANFQHRESVSGDTIVLQPDIGE